MNKSRMKIVCFLLITILVAGIFTGCIIANTTSKQHAAHIGIAATIVPTTESTTAEPTTTAPEKKKVKKVTEPLTEVVETDPPVEETNPEVVEEEKTSSDYIYGPSDFQSQGVIDWGGWTWTYYSQRVLPGEGLSIPGRHVDGNGYVCDENDYICLASSSLSWGTTVDTPFGKTGKVYDCGCASYILDVYVDW